MIPFSILDLAPITEGSDAAESFRRSLDLAQHGERWGYHRFWLAEHHGMPGIASAATAVLIAHIGSGTSTIRLGAGGIMLPNHSPLVVAEQFLVLVDRHHIVEKGKVVWAGTPAELAAEPAIAQRYLGI